MMLAERLSKWIGEHPSTFYPSLVHHPITPEPRTSKRDSYFILLPSNFFSTTRPRFSTVQQANSTARSNACLRRPIQNPESQKRRASRVQLRADISSFLLLPSSFSLTRYSDIVASIPNPTFNIRNLPFCFTRYSSFSLLKFQNLPSSLRPLIL